MQLSALPLWAYAGGVALVFGAGATVGWTVQGWRCDAAKTRAVEAALDQYEKNQTNAQTQAETYEADRADATRESGTRQTKIRVVYRDRVVNADCSLLPDAKRVLEDSVRAANSRASGEPES